MSQDHMNENVEAERAETINPGPNHDPGAAELDREAERAATINPGPADLDQADHDDHRRTPMGDGTYATDPPADDSTGNDDHVDHPR